MSNENVIGVQVCIFCNYKGHLRHVCMKERKGLQTMTSKEEAELTLTVEANDDTFDEQWINNLRIGYVGSKFIHRFQINNKCFTFEIDTAAAVTVAGLGVVEKMLGKIKLFSTNTRGSRLALLGRDWMRTLPVNWSEIIQKYLPHHKNKIKEIIRKYPVI